MSQRNPMNERYTQEDRSGKTRKSAASAKPTTKAASSVHIPGQGEKPKGMFARMQAQAASGDKKREDAKKNARAGTVNSNERALMYNPQIPEYKQWRRYWWAAIIAAIVFTISSFVALSTIDEGPLPFVLLGIGYIFLAFAIIIDIFKVRKIRKKYQEEVLNNRSKDATKSRKERKAAEKKRLAEAEAEEQRLYEERVAKKQARSERWGKVFGRGKAAAESAVLPKENATEEEIAEAEAAQANAAKNKKTGKVAATVATVKAAQAAAALESAEAEQAAEAEESEQS